MLRIIREKVSVDVATHIASQGFVQKLSGELRHDVENHFGSGQFVYGIYEDNVPVGFAIFQVFGEVLYLSGIILIPEVQGRGIAVEVVELAKCDTQTNFLALRTQSARMWAAGYKMCQVWIPHRDTVDRDLMTVG